MQFEFLRLSLLERRQRDAFEERSEAGAPFSRGQWLRSVFASPISFEHRRADFHYVPEPDADPVIIAGRVGRQVSIQENEPPEAGLKETWRDSWRAATLFIDPRHQEDGQKVAFEHDPAVGQPTPLFESIAEHINHRDPPSPFVIEVNPISDASDFWDFVHHNRGLITSVTFDLVAPNMFSAEEAFDREMRDMREKERARRVTIKIQNSDGLELETPRVRGAVEYAAHGGGSIRAKTKHHRKFNSKSKAHRIGIPDEILASASPLDLIKAAITAIFTK